jgi:hypothetical protein
VTTPDGKEIASWSRDAQGRLVDDPRPSVGPTYSEMVEDKLDASLVATRLVQRSAWFECTPYPDDVWQFVVKFDQKETLRDAIEHVRTT